MSEKKPSVARPLPEKSPGHVCFAQRGAEQPWDSCPADERLIEVEFYVDPSGAVLWRKNVHGVADECVVVTGASQIHDACQRMKCETPAATTRRLAESVVVAGGESGAANSTGQRSPKMKGKNSGKSILETWSQKFAENEALVKAGKKPMTDAELTAEMEKEFPEAKGKSTMTRVRMFRAHYNTGTHSFLKIGSAESRKLPRSWEYDAQGAKVEPGARRKAKAEKPAKKGDPDRVNMAEHAKKVAAAKKAGKKGGGKKRVVVVKKKSKK